jgi:peptidase E
MKQIIAMGGGGFSMEPDNLALDRYILEQTNKPSPSVCFLPTASGDADGYIVKFYSAFAKLDCRPLHLSLFRSPTADLESFVLEQDIIYVGGGNTRSMLALWREWRLDEILRQAWHQGIILAGLSAGAICWFEQGLTDSVPGRLETLDCLGFLPGSCCPHYDGEKERRPAYHRLLLHGKILPGFGIDDGAALHFTNRESKQVVTSRLGAKAYFVDTISAEVKEQPLESRFLLENQSERRTN